MDEGFATPARFTQRVGGKRRLGGFASLSWPTGQVYGTVKDLSLWLITNLDAGRFRNQAVIPEKLLAVLHRRQYEELARPTEDGTRSASA